MSYGYLGNEPSQLKSNTGIFTVNDVADLEQDNEFGGAMEFIESITVSNEPADFETLHLDKYAFHVLVFKGMQLTNDEQYLALRFNNGSGYQAGTAYVASMLNFGPTNKGEYKSNGQGYIYLSRKAGNQNKERINGIAWIYGLSSGQFPHVQVNSVYQDQNGQNQGVYGGGTYDLDTNAITGVRVCQHTTTDNLIEGQATLYGVKG